MIKYITRAFLLPALLFGCSSSKFFDNNNGSLNGKVEVSIGGSQVVTKTSIGDDLMSTQWSVDDQIAVWAKDAETESYAILAETFVLRSYGTTYSSATFTTNITEMDEGMYTYYGSYPTPISISDNTMVSYNVSSTQSGEYDGANDIMVATPMVSSELGSSDINTPSLIFNHLMHMIRIEIPDERNYFGRDLTRLDVTFPQDVVGNISFDVSSDNPSTSIESDGGSVVSVRFNEPFTTGDDNYIWLFVNPMNLNGEVVFTAYGEGGAVADNISTTLSKQLIAGNVTPITLTIPESIEVLTTFNVEISSADVLERIGEPLESITFTLPNGVYFDDGSSSVTVDAQSGDDTYNLYLVDAANYEAALMGGSLGIKLETASVEKSLDISLSDIVIGEVNSLGEVEVPYFFYSDFAEITKDGTADVAILSTTDAIDGMEGWTGGVRSVWYAGSDIALRSYYWWGVTYQSRANSCQVGNWGLKSGANVTLKITNNIKWTKENVSSMGVIVGRSTSLSLNGTITGESTDLSNYSGVLTPVTSMVSSVESDDYISWRTEASGGSTGKYEYVHIYDITVTIVNQ